jgi:predicted Zn-dependent protease
MTEREAESVLARVLSFASAEETEVSLCGLCHAATRFADDAITQELVRRQVSLTVTSAYGLCAGQATVEDLSDAALRRTVERAEALARSAIRDPERLPLPGPQASPGAASLDLSLEEAGPQRRAEAVRAAAARVREPGLSVAGSLTEDERFHAVTNSRGLFAFHGCREARFQSIVTTADSSGWAESTAPTSGQTRPVETTETAARKARAARAPRSVPAARYTVVLEPAAVAELLAYLAGSLDARSAHVGRSVFAGREGTRVGAPGLRLWSQPDHPDCPACPIAEAGLPAPAVTWIEDGVLRTLAYNRLWAVRCGRPFTGTPTNLLMAGSDAGMDELVGSVDRGILVTRFWRVACVEPQTLLLTGMTRDGLFWIEGGRVRHGLANMRFAESPLALLAKIVRAGRPARVAWPFPALVPPLVIDGFLFTGAARP